MTHQPRTEYLKTQVMTATPEMLQLMLWDGAIRFAEQGREAILKKDIEGSYTTLLRSQRIVMELCAGLRRDVNPELCSKLSALYNFIYRRLVDANVKKDLKFVDEALQIMRHQRETWVMLMDKLSEERVARARQTATENAEAIDASSAVSEAAQAAMAGAPTPAKSAAGRRGLYAGLAVQPPRAATLSVEG
jgi:flagellar protein FliS